jgi:iron-sulfur cluster repair protein YtfE (RIC family)
MLPWRNGSPPSEEARDPTDVLLKSHERIRHFTTVALRFAHSAHASPRLVRDAASALRRYFGTALPLHERDEEDFVTPRLLEGRSNPDLTHLLARMAGDHRAIDETLATLDELWARVMAKPETLALLSESLHAQARSLASLFETHLQLEEEKIFPAIALLPEQARKMLLHEMRTRRTSGTVSIRTGSRDGSR